MSSAFAFTETIFLTLALVVITIITHYRGLSLLHELTFARKATHVSLVSLMFGVLVLHLIEITIYGVGFWFGDIVLDVGNFAGRAVNYRDYFYFSAETYTTLGLGDIYPLGALRLIASVETLNGILMLGWSTSFSYLAMQRQWGNPPDK